VQVHSVTDEGSMAGLSCVASLRLERMWNRASTASVRHYFAATCNCVRKRISTDDEPIITSNIPGATMNFFVTTS
jgi:hypothetical protein